MFYSPRVSTISICNPIHVHEAIHTSWSYMNQHNVMQLLAYKAQSMQLQYVCNVKIHCNMSIYSLDNSIHVVITFSCHLLNTLTYKISQYDRRLINEKFSWRPLLLIHSNFGAIRIIISVSNLAFQNCADFNF